jgi:hypothetical protein
LSIRIAPKRLARSLNDLRWPTRALIYVANVLATREPDCVPTLAEDAERASTEAAQHALELITDQQLVKRLLVFAPRLAILVHGPDRSPPPRAISVQTHAVGDVHGGIVSGRSFRGLADAHDSAALRPAMAARPAS